VGRAARRSCRVMVGRRGKLLAVRGVTLRGDSEDRIKKGICIQMGDTKMGFNN